MMTTEGTVKLIDFGIAARSGARESYLAGKPASEEHKWYASKMLEAYERLEKHAAATE